MNYNQDIDDDPEPATIPMLHRGIMTEREIERLLPILYQREILMNIITNNPNITNNEIMTLIIEIRNAKYDE